MSASKHSKNLDRLADLHSDLINQILFELEIKVAGIVAALPTENGKLVDVQAAVAARGQIQQAIADTFILGAGDMVQSYDEAVATVVGMYQSVLDDSGLPPTQVTAINQLKQMAFAGFEDVASTHLEVMAREIYQSTLAGRSIDEVTKTIRHAINGVYIQSDDAEAQALVEFVQLHKDDESMKEEVDAAVAKLHSTYSRDRVGNNLRRYATVYAHDSLMQFSAATNMSVARELEIEKFKYYGDAITDTREWCRKHKGKTFTEQEIRDLWANNEWGGKAAGDPFIVRGGYNCRHHFVPVVD